MSITRRFLTRYSIVPRGWGKILKGRIGKGTFKRQWKHGLCSTGERIDLSVAVCGRKFASDYLQICIIVAKGQNYCLLASAVTVEQLQVARLWKRRIRMRPILSCIRNLLEYEKVSEFNQGT
jgi:hypothetical protein